MEPFEIDDALKSFRIAVDRREQDTPKARERYASFGVDYVRATLDYGDYCGLLPVSCADLTSTSARLKPKCVIERKMSLEELSSCFTHDRKRFEREFDRASEQNAKIYLLVENGSYEAIMMHRYRTKFRPEAFLASLTAWSVRYDMTPVFCKAATSGRLIKEILYRDMKERLVRGEFG